MGTTKPFHNENVIVNIILGMTNMTTAMCRITITMMMVILMLIDGGECEDNDDVHQSDDDDENLVPRQVKPIKQLDQLGSEIFL